MRRFRQILSGVGWDGVLFVIAGMVGFVVAILGWTGIYEMSADPGINWVLVSVSALLWATVSQTGRRTAEVLNLRQTLDAEMRRLRSEIGTSQIEVLEMRDSFPNALGERLTSETGRLTSGSLIVRDTTLRREVAIHSDAHQKYQADLEDQLLKGKVQFRKVEVIFNIERLRYVLMRLKMFQTLGEDYLLRHYNPPPYPIPVLDMYSIGGSGFYLGGYLPGNGANVEHVIFVESQHITGPLDNYWENLWNGAIPLNPGGRTDWDEIERIADRVGMSKDEIENYRE